MAKKTNRPERQAALQAVLTRLSKEAFEQLRAEALAEKRSMGSQVAVILEQRYAKED